MLTGMVYWNNAAVPPIYAQPYHLETTEKKIPTSDYKYVMYVSWYSIQFQSIFGD